MALLKVLDDNFWWVRAQILGLRLFYFFKKKLKFCISSVDNQCRKNLTIWDIAMADNELSSASLRIQLAELMPSNKGQKDTGRELKIKPPEINIQSAQQIIDGVRLPEESVARMEVVLNLNQALQSLNHATNLSFSVDEASNKFVVSDRA